MKPTTKAAFLFLAVLAIPALALFARQASTPTVHAQADTLVVELARTPNEAEYVAGYGKWLAWDHDAYQGCVGWCEDFYVPPEGDWKDPAYPHLENWTDFTHTYWTPIWDDMGWTPIASIGKHVSNARSPDMNDGYTHLHRRWFNVPEYPGYELDHVHMHLFSDNHSEWYVNGQHFHSTAANYAHEVDVWDASGFWPGMSNLLAVSVANNNVCSPHCNPHGIQYVIEAVFVQLPTPTPTATPYVQAYARNPQSTPVPLAQMGRSRFNSGGSGQVQAVAGASDYTNAAMDYGGYTYRGAYFDGYDEQVLLGVTPSANGHRVDTVGNNFLYGWANWHTGGRSVVAVYATRTPTPTPTPYLVVRAVDPGGNPVQVEGMRQARFNSSGGLQTGPIRPNVAELVETPRPYNGRAYRGGGADPYGNQVRVAETRIPDTGSHARNQGGYRYVGWSNWHTGRRELVLVYATQTPTPSPTPTSTPTPTHTPTPTNTPPSPPTPTPEPYVLPPTIRPFLHLRGHDPPYDEKHVDYLASDDVYHFAQVYVHAVPAAEIVDPPLYCEWTATGWRCSPADIFRWRGYTFHGVEREGHWFPSPAGDVTKLYTSYQHTFDPNPRWSDPDYAWPDEFLHLYFNLPAGTTPPCPVTGHAGPCLVYDDRAPGEETLVATLHARARWIAAGRNVSFDLAAEYPLTLTATQWETP